MLKPFSQACANNAEPILKQLSALLSNCKTVLEIGSGTGQHAVYFGSGLPHLVWQTSDLKENHEGILQWLDESTAENVLPPLKLDVSKQKRVADSPYDAIFMANTLHIMPWSIVEDCFHCTACHAAENSLLIVYGPFNYAGQFTSESNARFDQWLKAADGERGIRDFEKVNQLASTVGYEHEQDIEMPANNRLLVWRFKGK